MISDVAIHLHRSVLREFSKIQHDVWPHAHSVDLELVVADETHCNLVLWGHLKVRVLVERKAVLVPGHINQLKELRVRGGIVGHGR